MSDEQHSASPSDRQPPEVIDIVDFDDPILMGPTLLERLVGHELDDESAAFIYAAMRAFGVDAQRADFGYRLFCQLRQEESDDERGNDYEF
jgi:hypothetical protein